MKAILHADLEWGIGKNNSLMFSLPEDMKFFKRNTEGKVVVMGYNTLLSLPKSQPLKNRVNVVLAPKEHINADCIFVYSLEELFALLSRYDSDNVFIIGGASVYRQLLPYCSEVLVTKVNAVGGADTFFKNLDEDEDFVLVEQSDTLQTGGYDITFTTYKNKRMETM